MLHNIPGPTLQAIASLQLPALPQTVLGFMRAVSQDGTSVDQVGTWVRREPALAARILHVANSAAFHTAGPLRNIEQCLQTLGVRILRSVAACLAVQQAFGRLPGLQPGLQSYGLAGFWRHALLVAELAQGIAAETGRVEPEEAYLSGLLHDVGQLLLLGGLGAAYGRILEGAHGETALVACEQRALGTDHAAVGAWLVDRWKLPSFMADAILFHHHDAQAIAQSDDLTRTVWAAHAAEALAAHDTPDTADFGQVAGMVHLQPLLLARLCGTAQANVAQLAAALGLPAAASALPQWSAERALQSRPQLQAQQHAHQHAHQQVHQQVHQQALQDALSSMAALQPLQHELASADSEAELLAAARESACILFGVADVVFMIRPMAESASVSASGVKPVPGAVASVPLPGQSPLLARLNMALEPGARDACARAARSRALCCTFEPAAHIDPGGPALRDLQLARLLGSQGLVCAPMVFGEAVWGVMVLPVDAASAECQRQRADQVLAFAGIVAGHLRAWRALRERQRDAQAAAADGLLLRERQVAHEVSNPLGIIKTYLQIMQRKLPESLCLENEMQVLREEIDRVARIVRQLGEAPTPPASQASPASPASPESPASGLIDLNTAVEGLWALYGGPLFEGTGITPSLNLQRPMEPTRAASDTVRQLLLNLWKNAAEALPPGSHVVTATTDHVYRDGCAYTQLSVSDDGPGLPPEVTRSAFQPQGSRQPSGRSGLGLSIVHNLVAGLGGHVSCQTAAGRGTRFEVLLPQGQAETTATGGRP